MDEGGVRLRNQRFFDRQICAATQIREFGVEWMISVKKKASPLRKNREVYVLKHTLCSSMSLRYCEAVS